MQKHLTLKKSNCKNCYKCIRHCPVKAIRFSAGQAHIIHEECILCGHCFVVCPQNAKEITSEVEKVKVFLQSEEPVFVSLAPSFVANYEGAGINSMRTALKKMGFFDVEETALGATVVKREYEKMLEERKPDVLISSCCHSINLLIQKHYPEALPYLAQVMSPMQAHCRSIKERYPEAKTVFVGPCVSKKDEAYRYEGIVDAVLTFEELSEWMKKEGIVPEICGESTEQSRARLFPTTGGILNSFSSRAPGYSYLAIDGVENCIAALKDIIAGKIHNCFVEMNACVGSCVGGPIMEKYHHSSIRDTIAVQNYAGSADFEVTQPENGLLHKGFPFIDLMEKMPAEEELQVILHQMGKDTPQQQLNCGSCGYNTCREKAIAIFRGKADVSMCLPYLKERAESFSDSIVKNTPNGILVLNEQLEVQQVNCAAKRIMNLRSASDILGDQVIRILDPAPFIRVRDTGRSVHNARTYLAEYKRYVEQTVTYDAESHLLICIMRDITDEENEREAKDTMRAKTFEVADNVVEKQMRVAQEIASLLGETVAETKIALSKLKESISDE